MKNKQGFSRAFGSTVPTPERRQWMNVTSFGILTKIRSSQGSEKTSAQSSVLKFQPKTHASSF